MNAEMDISKNQWRSTGGKSIVSVTGLEKHILKLQRYLLTYQANSAFMGKFWQWAAAIVKTTKVNLFYQAPNFKCG